MYKYQNIMFDLDGTITDSGKCIMECVQYSLDAFGFHNEPEENLRKFVGPSLMDSFTNRYGMSHEDALAATERFRQLYTAGKMYEVTLYDGIVDLLKKLQADGLNINLVTSKAHPIAVKLMEKLGLDTYFTHIVGPELSDPSSEKARLINKAIEKQGLDRESVVMIGDTHFDIEGAVEAGVDSIGVTYGYGENHELTEAGATYLADTTSDILSLLTA